MGFYIMQCVILQPKGTTRNANVPPALISLPTCEDIAKLLRRAGPPECVGTWKCGTQMLHLFGYKTGKAGTENKHELQPPHDEVILFGEAVIVATTDENLTTFTVASYTKFYNEAAQEGSESDSDIDSEVEADEYASEVEEGEVVSDSDSDSDSDTEEEILEEEEEEDIPPPVRIPKPKRTNKKIPAWWSIQEFTHTDDSNPKSPFRQIGMKRISTFLPSLSVEEQEGLEKGIFRFCLDDAKRKHVRAVWENSEFQTLYDIQIRRILSNMDAKSYVGNARLLERFKDGEFKIWEIPYMTYQDLCPEKWVELSEREMKREARMLEVDTSMATDMFRCSRCGKRQCTYYEQQTRSADEPMTIFIRCINCSKQWRQ